MKVWGELGWGRFLIKTSGSKVFPTTVIVGGLSFSTSEYVSKLRHVYWGNIKIKNSPITNYKPLFEVPVLIFSLTKAHG